LFGKVLAALLDDMNFFRNAAARLRLYW